MYRVFCVLSRLPKDGDPESFVRGWGSKNLDFFCFIHHILQRVGGVCTNHFYRKEIADCCAYCISLVCVVDFVRIHRLIRCAFNVVFQRKVELGHLTLFGTCVL